MFLFVYRLDSWELLGNRVRSGFGGPRRAPIGGVENVMSRQLAGRLLVLAIAVSEGAGGCANGGDDGPSQTAGAGGTAAAVAAGVGGASGIAGAANVAGSSGGA